MKRGRQTGPTEVWYTLLEIIRRARQATGLTSDEHLAEEFLAAFRGMYVPSIRTVRIALAREQRAPDPTLVSPRTLRRWREERKRMQNRERPGVACSTAKSKTRPTPAPATD